MASRRGVTCPECGASTLLPDDLTVPSFACAFCHAVLSTAAFAGVAVLLGAMALYHWVEEPARRWMRRMVDYRDVRTDDRAGAPPSRLQSIAA